MPSRVQQRARVPEGHPRLFLRPEELPRLRELAQGSEGTGSPASRRRRPNYLRRSHAGTRTSRLRPRQEQQGIDQVLVA